MDSQFPKRFIILADDSANWKIGGLRQLERIALAVNDLATDHDSEINIFVFWKPEIPVAKRWLPKHPRLTNSRVSLTEQDTLAQNEILSTRLLLTRRGLSEFPSISTGPGREDQSSSKYWEQINSEFEKNCRSPQSDIANEWCLLSGQEQIPAGERWLLRSTGKSYDGLVSKYLNRPFSRFVSRVLLRFPVTPNQWTAIILICPAAACYFLSRGTYLGFVIGTALYQGHSILDGCDGEIARIKYLDSKRGPGIDSCGDVIALLLLVAGLGIGLFNSHRAGRGRLFLVEAIVAFVLIAVRLGRNAMDLLARGMDAVHSSEHEESLKESGNRFFGRTLYPIISAIARRDVIFVVFLLMALFDLASWILHVLFIYSVIAMLLLLKGHSMRTARQIRPVLP